MEKLNLDSIFNDSQLCQKAYKKLKSNMYYDKTQVILKKEIVEFEANKKSDKELDDSLIEIWKKLVHSTDDEWTNYIKKEILYGIHCIFLPKKLKENQEKDSCIISNVEDDLQQIEVEKEQAFIRLPVIGHILSVVWVMTIGAVIDKSMTNCYGNRLREDFYHMEDCCSQKKKITFSPYLFKPYYLQYEKWQDNALKVAEQHLKNNDDILIFTLDFERFYYSLDITDDFMKNIFKEVCLSNEGEEIKKHLNRLNDFVNSVIECYAMKYKKYFPDTKKRILPIGFLPSNILANYALKKFDESILNSWNPLYFGRYVDDVIIVDKISHSHPLYEKIRSGKITMTEFIAEYLRSCCKWGILQANTERQECRLDSRLLSSLGKHTELSFNMKKCKIFYFSPENSTELLTTFRKHLEENKSEFRFLPEDEVTFQENDYTKLFDIDQHEINKFKDISGIRLNKYNLSKFLAKQQQITSYHLRRDNRLLNRFIKSLTDTQLIDNYVLWERIITILGLQKEKKQLVDIVLKIGKSINKINYTNQAVARNMRLSLYRFLFFDLCRVQSALCLFSNSHDDCFKPYKNCHLLKRRFSTFCRLSVAYERARMGDKYLYAIWPDVFLICQNSLKQKRDVGYKPYSRNNLQDTFRLLADAGKKWRFIKIKLQKYKYYPYLIQNYDILLAQQCISLASASKQPGLGSPFSAHIYDETFELFLEVNFQFKLDSLDKAEGESEYTHGYSIEEVNGKSGYTRRIAIMNEPKKKFKIAISNIKIKHEDTEKNLVRLPTTTPARWEDISCLVNGALKNHADILVMPECCLPFSWLSSLAHTCKKNDLAVITGLEHLIVGKQVYNLVTVILPFKENNVPCALVVLHPKNYFSPKEFESLFERGFIPMDADHLLGKGQTQYELYKWHDLYFSVYCCFELSSITERALFQSYADAIFAVEWNQDIYYYQNILEALARDLHCYCIQANSSDYGDSRITQPSKHDNQDILRVKGGEAPTVLIGTIDVEKLRLFQCKGYGEQKADRCFKPTPPLFNREIVEKKIRKEKLF
jgi:hypothetical protein